MTDASCLSGGTLVHFSHNYTRVTPESTGSSAGEINVACERQTRLLAHRRWGTFREKRTVAAISFAVWKGFVAFNNIDDFFQYSQTVTFSFLS